MAQSGSAPPRVYRRAILRLTRMRERSGDPTSRTLCFKMPGNGPGNSRSVFVEAENVPEFDGENAEFLMELVEGVPWSFWRAVRQVEKSSEHEPPIAKA